MNQLTKYDNIATDANIIIYYCFKTKETQITELTEKSHKIIEFLRKHKIILSTPQFMLMKLIELILLKKLMK